MSHIMKALGFVVLLIFISLIVLVGLQVFLRYVLRTPLFWANDLSRLLFLWTIMLSVPLSYYNNTLPKMDEIINRMFKSKHILVIVNIVNNFLVLGFGIFMIIYGYNLSMFVANQILPTLSISFGYIYISTFFSGLLMVAICIDKLFAKTRELKSDSRVKDQ